MVEMVKQISDDLMQSMTAKDSQAMGRLHQACFQLVETCSLFGLPESLLLSIKRFETVKMRQSDSAKLRCAMERCQSSMGAYLATSPSDPASRVRCLSPLIAGGTRGSRSYSSPAKAPRRCF